MDKSIYQMDIVFKCGSNVNMPQHFAKLLIKGSIINKTPAEHIALLECLVDEICCAAVPKHPRRKLAPLKYPAIA